MPTFLVRSYSQDLGYELFNPPGGMLPRTGAESYVPWALTSNGQVVYARTGEHTSWRGGIDRNNGNRASIRPYDTNASQQRRRLCETVLGMTALERPAFSAYGVRKVSAGIKRYLLTRFWNDQQRTRQVVYDQIGHYFFTGGRMGFGRISTASKRSLGVVQVWLGIIDTLSEGRLEQVMAIHDAVGRKVLPELGGPELARYNEWGPIVRQDWFDNSNTRGRIDSPAQRARQVQPTVTGGIGHGAQRYQASATLQSRNRGVDMFQRDMHRTRHPEADAYYDDLDMRNLLFGAGISGTTGTLLQAAHAFGNLTGERLKQYVLAIIGYLVGGGMHSYHETMAVAQRVGVPYTPGSFLPSLPNSFLNSIECRRWTQAFYDIVVLGALHWRYNAGVIPSHLNKELRQCLQFVMVGGPNNGLIGPIV